MRLAIAIVVVLFAGGCGSITLTNGNKVTLHERLGVTGSLQVAEETTAEDTYVGHEVFVGPGMLPLITRSASEIVAGRESRYEDVIVDGDGPHEHDHGHHSNGNGHGGEDD